MKKTVLMILFVVSIVMILFIVCAKNMSKKELATRETLNLYTTPKVTRGLKQNLINKNGEEIKGNAKYDHGAHDRDVTFDEMVPGKTYYSYVYDDSLTEEENQELFLQLGSKAFQEYLTKSFDNSGEDIKHTITDRGIATSEGTISIVD